MPLYKPGKEHTINFIYCWAVLHPDPSRHSGPISKGWSHVCGFGTATGITQGRRAHPKSGEGPSGSLFLLAAQEDGSTASGFCTGSSGLGALPEGQLGPVYQLY